VTEIRPVTTEDLPAVLSLLKSHLSEWAGDLNFLQATVLAHPWADPELPSLVATGGDGAVVGFIGAAVRRLRFDGDPLRGVCCSHLVVAPEQRRTAAGALLLGKLLTGPQELTWSDSMNRAVARMWQTFGGHLDHSRACDWMLVLRPRPWLRSNVAEVARRRRIARERIPVGAVPLQALRRHGPRGAEPGVEGHDATAEEIVEVMPSLTARLRLFVDYDVAHLEHLRDLIVAREGGLVCRIVQRRGRAVGWYAYLPRPGAASRVLQLCAAARDTDAVLGELVEHARDSGSLALAGRLEPNLDGALRDRGAVLSLAREPALHAEDTGVRATLATSSSLLSQLDSEWFVT
jgi:hypothetical protein